jgi:hypothetical protein
MKARVPEADQTAGRAEQRIQAVVDGPPGFVCFDDLDLRPRLN